jgi:hypothetical protein
LPRPANSSSSAPTYPAGLQPRSGDPRDRATDSLASFSNYGSWIKLSAPGESILTTEKGGGYWSCYGLRWPHRSRPAVGALALSANPSLRRVRSVTLLEKNSDDLGAPGFDSYFGWGRV